MKYRLYWFVVVCLLSGCGNTLLDDVYKYTNSSDNKELYTAFIILSNMELSDTYVDKIEQDYRDEDDLVKRYLFEFVLAKRTQQANYIVSFIDSSKSNLPLLTRNDSNWISLDSPVLELLSIYSTTSDEALSILFLLIDDTNDASPGGISAGLRRVHKADPARFSRIAEAVDVNLEEVLMLMVDE
ncbi:MAG: hypothetical protein KBT75_01825 [Oleispira antarctica]|nr:hypothetical protein [Oleispira antarctica]MBQ0791786.1 hypothetical protein [Oleispira antarctica]